MTNHVKIVHIQCISSLKIAEDRMRGSGSGDHRKDWEVYRKTELTSISSWKNLDYRINMKSLALSRKCKNVNKDEEKPSMTVNKIEVEGYGTGYEMK